MSIRRYFDLSKPATFGTPKPEAARRETPRHEDARVSPTVRAGDTESGMNLGWQIATYFILLLSILASRFLDLYRAGVPGQFQLDWAYLLFMAIVSLLAFPVVYDKARLNKGQPFFMQVCLIFTAGMGWEKIVATAIGK